MDQALNLRGAKLMQMAKRRLMIMPAPSSMASFATDSPVGVLEHAIQVLDRLIRLCNSSSRNIGASTSGVLSSASLKFNHAQCRYLDLQSFHDNLRNLVDEMTSLNPACRDQCKSAVMEIAKVTRNAETLVMSWVSSDEEESEDSWLVKAILYSADDGLAAAQQRTEQQWCVSILEVVLAQFRADRDDSSKHKTKLTSATAASQRHVPYWMIDRTFEIAEEFLLGESDRGLEQAVRLDRRILLDKLRRLKHKHDGFFYRSMSVFSSRNRKSSIRSQELTSYLITKLDMDKEEMESFVERIHQSEAWASDNVSSKKQTDDVFLGTGQFGRVQRSDFLGFPAAVKVTSFHSWESFWNEVSVLASIRHPRLAQLIFASTTDEETGECRLWTELLGTSLGASLDLILKADEVPQLMVAVELMLQVAEGMEFLHRRGVLHRHLKASNVLIVPRRTSNWQRRKKSSTSRHELNEFVQVKITDYGLPKTKFAGWSFLQNLSDDDDDDNRAPEQQQQLPFWQAPEVFQQGTSEVTFTKKSDVYSFAMLCYQILSCKRPFSDSECPSENLLFRLVSVERVRPRILPLCPAFLAAVIERCWIHEPQKRLSFTQICLALRVFKGLLMRRQADILPCTPSDFGHLVSHLGLTFLVDTIILHMKQQHADAAMSPFLMMLEAEDKNFWPFPVDNFVVWLASSVEQLEQEEGFGAAAEMTGDLLANWIGPKHDFEQAVFWYYKASSCKSRTGGSARWKLGMCMESGLGISKDEKRAVGLYKQAAREGCASAHVEIGRCYQSGKGMEAGNFDKAMAHYAKALEMVENEEVGGGGTIDFVELMLKMISRGHREEDCVWAGERIQEVAAKSRVGRMVIAGQDWCNVRELVGMLGDWRVKEAGRRRAKMVLERLAIEDDILHKALLA